MTNTLLQAVTLQAAARTSRTCMSIDLIRTATLGHEEYLVDGGHLAGRGVDPQDLHVNRPHSDRYIEATTNTLLQAVTLQAAVKISRNCKSIDPIRTAT